jgi:hypothetical protein
VLRVVIGSWGGIAPDLDCGIVVLRGVLHSTLAEEEEDDSVVGQGKEEAGMDGGLAF